MKMKLLGLVLVLLVSLTSCDLIKPSEPVNVTDDEEIETIVNQKGGILTLEDVGELEFDTDALEEDCEVYFATARSSRFEQAELMGYTLGESLVEIDLSPEKALDDVFTLTLETDWETPQVIYISFEDEYELIEGKIRRNSIAISATEPGYYGVVAMDTADTSNEVPNDSEIDEVDLDLDSASNPDSETNNGPETETEVDTESPDNLETILYQGTLVGVNRNEIERIDPNTGTKELLIEVDEAYKIFSRPLNTIYPLLLGKSILSPNQLALVNPLTNGIELIDVIENGDIQRGIWSPDGEMAALIVTNYTTQQEELYIYKTQAQASYYIDHSKDGWFMDICWSSDSQHLIYTQGIYDNTTMQYNNILKIKTMGSDIETIISYPAASAYLHGDTADLVATDNSYYGYGIKPESETNIIETFFKLEVPSLTPIYFDTYEAYFFDYMTSVRLGQQGYDLYYDSTRFGMPKFTVSDLTDAVVVNDWGSSSLLPAGQLDQAKWISQAYSDLRFVSWN